jgi:hypothetical protein
MTADRARAPWTARQVKCLQRYQRCDYTHEYTGVDGRPLVPRVDGWAAVIGGPVVQDWCLANHARYAHCDHSRTVGGLPTCAACKAQA